MLVDFLLGCKGSKSNLVLEHPTQGKGRNRAELQEKNRCRKQNTMGLVPVTCLRLSLRVGLVFLFPQSSFIYVAEKMSLDFPIIKFQQPESV